MTQMSGVRVEVINRSPSNSGHPSVVAVVPIFERARYVVDQHGDVGVPWSEKKPPGGVSLLPLRARSGCLDGSARFRSGASC